MVIDMDIVERLREYETWSEDWPIIKEAADEIERLREQERKMTSHALDRMEEIERLREALKPFAEIADDWDHLDDEDYVSVHKYDIELRHFRAIRSALQQKDSE